jgi:hypothetical protein
MATQCQYWSSGLRPCGLAGIYHISEGPWIWWQYVSLKHTFKSTEHHNPDDQHRYPLTIFPPISYMLNIDDNTLLIYMRPEPTHEPVQETGNYCCTENFLLSSEVVFLEVQCLTFQSSYLKQVHKLMNSPWSTRRKLYNVKKVHESKKEGKSCFVCTEISIFWQKVKYQYVKP